MTTRRDWHYWTSSCGRIELLMTSDDAASASHPGPCDADVYALSKIPRIKRQIDAIDPATLRLELREYGAWDNDALDDHEANLQRLLWIAAADISGGEA